jgi:hypothetical protein
LIDSQSILHFPIGFNFAFPYLRGSEIVERLSKVDQEGKTPFHHPEIVLNFLEHYPDLRFDEVRKLVSIFGKKDKNGRTPLHNKGTYQGMHHLFASMPVMQEDNEGIISNLFASMPARKLQMLLQEDNEGITPIHVDPTLFTETLPLLKEQMLAIYPQFSIKQKRKSLLWNHAHFKAMIPLLIKLLNESNNDAIRLLTERDGKGMSLLMDPSNYQAAKEGGLLKIFETKDPQIYAAGHREES